MPAKKPSPRKRKSSPSRKKRRTPRSRAWSRLAPGLLAAAIFLALAVLLTLPQPEPEQTQTVRDGAPSAQVVLERLGEEVETLLAAEGVTSGQVTQQPSEGVIDLEIVSSFPSAERVREFGARLAGISSDLSLETLASRGELRVFHEVALVARLHYRPPPAPREESGPRVAIIIDDLGRDLQIVRRLIALDAPLTFAFLPGTAHPTEGARLAHAAAREILVHLPMEPQGFPAINPGSDALLIGHSDEEILSRLAGHFARVPYAVGANNHMGSRFTEYRVGMQTVAGYLKQQGVFFVDSATTGGTIAEAVAREEGVPATRRDVFLDNVPDVAKIRAQLRQLAELARVRGQAVGIGHPYPETLEALRLELPRMKKAGVRVVPVSRLVGFG